MKIQITNQTQRKLFFSFVIYLLLTSSLPREVYSNEWKKKFLNQYTKIDNKTIKWLTNNFSKIKAYSFDEIKEYLEQFSSSSFSSISQNSFCVNSLTVSCFITEKQIVLQSKDPRKIILAIYPCTGVISIFQSILHYHLFRFPTKKVEFCFLKLNQETKNMIKNQLNKHNIKTQFLEEETSSKIFRSFAPDLDIPNLHIYNICRIHKRITPEFASQVVNYYQSLEFSKRLTLYKPPFSQIARNEIEDPAFLSKQENVAALILMQYMREHCHYTSKIDLEGYRQTFTMHFPKGKDFGVENEILDIAISELFHHAKPYELTTEKFKFLFRVSVLNRTFLIFEERNITSSIVFDPMDFEASIEILLDELIASLEEFSQRYEFSVIKELLLVCYYTNPITIKKE